MSLFNRLLGTFQRQSLENDIAEEQHHHLELAARELEQEGHTREEARRLARLRFGSNVDAHEETRRADTFPWIEDIVRDLRIAVRALGRSPSYSVVVLLALALGIGANTAIYSVVRSVLLRALPYPNPEELAVIYTKLSNGRRTWANFEDIRDWAQGSKTFRSLSGWAPQTVNLTGIGEPDRLRGGFISASFFTTMGIQPAIGRSFTEAEVIPNGPRVAIASWGMWQERFGARPSFLNSKVILNGEPYVIVGILPKEFDFPFDKIDVWLPFPAGPSYRQDRASVNAGAIGRLAGGATRAEAEQELSAKVRSLAAEYPDTNRERTGAQITSLHQSISDDTKPQLLMLSGAVFLALLVGCANIATLTVSRVLSRSRELGIRAALGAGRGRLASHLFSEQLLLSVTGAGLGLLLAYWFTRLPLITKFLPPMLSPAIDWQVAIVCLGLALLSALLTGPVPGLSVLRSIGRSMTESRAVKRTRQGLVTASIALSIILLAGAGLLVRSFNALTGIDPGFKPDHLLTLEYRMPQTKYPKPEQQIQFHRQVAREVAAVPGVRNASVMMAVPFGGNGNFGPYQIVGQPPARKGGEPRAQINRVDPTYFDTMGIPLLTGRVFTEADGSASQQVAVISKSMAERCWPKQDPMNRQLILFSDKGPFTVVGVVKDSKHGNLEEESPDKAYVPFAQMPHLFGTLAVRTVGEPMAMAPAVRQAVWKVDRDQPMWKVRSMEAMMDATVTNRRVLANLMSSFSGFALLLATIGLYGIVSYSMSRRSKELGIRAALGATQSRLVQLVLGEGVRNIAVGSAIGLLCAIPAARLIESQLFRVQSSDPEPYITALLALTGAALLATLLPARKAAMISPSDVLRQD